MTELPYGPAYVSPKALHILEVLVRNPDGLYALDIVRMTWGHVGNITVHWRLNELCELGLVRIEFPDRPMIPGELARPVYKATSAGVSELGYAMDAAMGSRG